MGDWAMPDRDCGWVGGSWRRHHGGPLHRAVRHGVDVRVDCHGGRLLGPHWQGAAPIYVSTSCSVPGTSCDRALHTRTRCRRPVVQERAVNDTETSRLFNRTCKPRVCVLCAAMRMY